MLVAADDRTGACEVAAALADHGAGPVPVVVRLADLTDGVGGADSPGGGVRVVDLASRHLSPGEAYEVAAALPPTPVAAHKIDSALRGNWPDELVGRHVATGAPVLLVPALPRLGRTCEGGVVLVHGRPVHEGRSATDVRRRVATSRPADALAGVAARHQSAVCELARPDDVGRWLDEPDGIAIADAASEATIGRIVELWRRAGQPVVLAGTSAVIGRAHAGGPPAEPLPPIDGAVLVACGSVHPAARSQVRFAEQRGIEVTHMIDRGVEAVLHDGRPVVLVTEIPVGDVTEPRAVAAASGVAHDVRHLLATGSVGVLVVIGGDTAAAVIGDAEVVVHGSIDDGTAWATVAGIHVPVVTRSGGFGSESALVDLVRSAFASGR